MRATYVPSLTKRPRIAHPSTGMKGVAISVPRLIPERVRKHMRDRLITVSFHRTCFVALSRRTDETHQVPFLQGSSHVIMFSYCCIARYKDRVLPHTR